MNISDQLWYFFASRNHRVYPICREEAVRLLRSTRMARAYSEGAYSSDFDYERYWHARLLHLCIRPSCGLLKFPSSVFNLSVTVHVMTENDILCDIGFLLRSHHSSDVVWMCSSRYTTASVCWGSELFVLLISAVRRVCWLWSKVLVSTWLFLCWCRCLCTHGHYTNRMLTSGVCDY